MKPPHPALIPEEYQETNPTQDLGRLMCEAPGASRGPAQVSNDGLVAAARGSQGGQQFPGPITPEDLCQPCGLPVKPIMSIS